MSVVLDADGYGLVAVTEVDPTVLDTFSCGKRHLDEFLTQRAAFFHKEWLGFVWIVLHRDMDYPIGYFSLNNEALELSDAEETNLGMSDYSGLKRFPAIMMGRLAVDTRLQGSGASTQLMHMALDMIGGRLATSPLSAARLVIVDADNDPKVLRYYEKHGFERSSWADKQATHQGGKKSRATVKMLRDILQPW